MSTTDCKTPSANTQGWVYVYVNNTGGNEVFVGLHDADKDLDFIPAFESKEAANDCFLSLPREKGTKYEVQAVHIQELSASARQRGFTVAIVDGDGNILKQAE
jgi:hypothetical protein